MKERTYKYYAKTNPSWFATLTSDEKEEALSGKMYRKSKAQWAKEYKEEKEREQKDHDDWYGEY